MQYIDGSLLMALVLESAVLIVVLAAALAVSTYAGRARRADRAKNPAGARALSEAEEMLEMRFALGEIDATELTAGRLALRREVAPPSLSDKSSDSARPLGPTSRPIQPSRSLPLSRSVQPCRSVQPSRRVQPRQPVQ